MDAYLSHACIHPTECSVLWLYYYFTQGSQSPCEMGGIIAILQVKKLRQRPGVFHPTLLDRSPSAKFFRDCYLLRRCLSARPQLPALTRMGSASEEIVPSIAFSSVLKYPCWIPALKYPWLTRDFANGGALPLSFPYNLSLPSLSPCCSII